MRRILYWCVTAVFLLSIASMPFAAEPVDKATLESLVKGNTAEGTSIKWNNTFKLYFDPSGKYSRLDSKNNQENGKWAVSDKGELVMTGFKKNKEQKRDVKKRDDGVYEIFGDGGQLIWTIEKVTPGNPYDLPLK